MIQKLYPGGRSKAFNFSYDDGVEQDVRFAALLNRYGLKGTFNLNSGLMRSGFQWTHESGLTVKRLPLQAAADVYRGHEVAAHTLTHPMLENLSPEQILAEMTEDRANLEAALGCRVEGLAIPFTYHDQRICDCSRQAGFTYTRISDTTGGFDVPEDPFRWKATMFHLEEGLEEQVDNFLHTDQELALFQLIGHSYDLDVYQMWERMEILCQRLSQCTDVWPATHIQILRYLRHMEQSVITEKEVINRSTRPLWFRINGVTKVIYPGEKEKYL